MWKWVFAILGFGFLALAAIIGTFVLSPGAREWAKSRVPKPEPTEVRLEEVTRGELTRVINAPGSIEPKTKVQISAQVAARITELPYRENQMVRKGDVVVRLDSRDLAAALESAQASQKAEESRREGLRASLAMVEAEAARARDLFASKDKSKAELDAAEEAFLRTKALLEASTHNIEIARANIARAQKDLENAVIVAPFDGTIVKLNAEVGELVLVGTLNNAASVIMEIADLSTMLMKARVDEANIAPVLGGQTTKVYINAYQGRPFAGRVERVGLKRQIDRDGTGYFEVEILVNKPEEQILASGLTANVDIEVQKLENIIKVPSQAVVDRRIDSLPKETADDPLVDHAKAFATVVYIIGNDGKAKAVPVRTGVSDLTHTVIEKGIEPGARIITGPFKVLVDLADGKDVKAESPKPAGKSAPAAPGGTGAAAAPPATESRS